MVNSQPKILFICLGNLILFCSQSLNSKDFPFPGEKPLDPGFHAFVGGDIQVNPDERIKDGILLIQGGIIEEIGKNIEIPSFYREWNCSGKTIYPGFIDPYLLSGSEDPSLFVPWVPANSSKQSNTSFVGLPENSYNNNDSKFGIPGSSEKRLIDSIDFKDKKWDEFRKYGFTSASRP